MSSGAASFNTASRCAIRGPNEAEALLPCCFGSFGLMDAERSNGKVAHLAQTWARLLSWCSCIGPGSPSSDPLLQCCSSFFRIHQAVATFVVEGTPWLTLIPSLAGKPRFGSAFPHSSRPQATVLALWSYGMVLAKACGITWVSAALALQFGKKEARAPPMSNPRRAIPYQRFSLGFTNSPSGVPSANQALAQTESAPCSTVQGAL